jgi:hypothetical protein
MKKGQLTLPPTEYMRRKEENSASDPNQGHFTDKPELTLKVRARAARTLIYPCRFIHPKQPEIYSYLSLHLIYASTKSFLQDVWHNNSIPVCGVLI